MATHGAVRAGGHLSLGSRAKCRKGWPWRDCSGQVLGRSLEVFILASPSKWLSGILQAFSPPPDFLSGPQCPVLAHRQVSWLRRLRSYVSHGPEAAVPIANWQRLSLLSVLIQVGESGWHRSRFHRSEVVGKPQHWPSWPQFLPAPRPPCGSCRLKGLHSCWLAWDRRTRPDRQADR